MSEFTLTEAQTAGIERTDLSMAVTSGAGCGKTFVLARRYVKLLLDDGRPDAPGRIVAVTFTDKAAIEMRQRVAALLAERAEAATDEQDRELYAEWLSRIPDGRISTIHGFCSSLLRANAIEAGLDPAFGVGADEFARRRMLREAIAEATREAFDSPDEHQDALLDAVPFARICDMLAAAVDERWRWSSADYADPDATLRRWTELRAQTQSQTWEAWDPADVQRSLDNLGGATCSNPSDKLAVHLGEQIELMSELLANPDARTPANFARVKSAGNRGSAAAWGGKEAMIGIRDQLRSLAKRFGEIAWLFAPMGDADFRSANCLMALTALADRAAERYAAAKRAAGVLDFVDLLVLTRDLLASNDAVRRRVAGEIGQMLIDEFQDTDSLQRELLYLAVDCVSDKPPAGRVFFVGDVKQSIYRFRGAEVDVFARAQEAMDAEGRRVLDLNFRTHAKGVALVNRIFEPLMGEGYEPLTAQRPEAPADPAAEFLFVQSDPADKAEDRVKATARAIAGRIAEMLGDRERRVWDAGAGDWRPVRAGDIVILLRRLQNTAPYEDALGDAGVDHYVVAGAGLFRQQEVFELTNALRAIDNPTDDVALMGFLRGGMVGLSDNILAHVAAMGEPPHRGNLWDDRLAERLAPAELQALHRAAETLDNLAATKDACGVDGLIERLLAATGYEAVLLGQYNGHRKCGNVHRVLEHARQAHSDGATLSEFVAYLSELTVEEVRAEQAATEAEGGDVVRIMTIHKAKGLEFPVVILADLNHAPKNDSPRLGHRSHWGLTLRGDNPDGDRVDPVSWTLARWGERQRALQEDCRTLYVAVTRHRDHIVFVAAAERVGDRLGVAHSALRLLDDALDLAGAIADGGVAVADGVEASVRFWAAPATRRETVPSWLDEIHAAADSPEALAIQLNAPVAAGADGAAPLLAAPPIAAVERLAVTALSEFEACPARFRWRYELRVSGGSIGSGPAAQSSAAPVRSAEGLDAATAGTVYHRCMELLDFADPQPAATLARRALADVGAEADPGPLAAELERMLATLGAHPLWTLLAGARRRWAELTFVTRFGRLETEGVIDLLAQDAAGDWHIVDYKSDRVSADHVAAGGARYELQMLIYAAAARRFLAKATGSEPEIDATLYFLRPGRTHVFSAEHVAAAAAESRLTALADQLGQCRSSGIWPRCAPSACGLCPYAPLCDVGA